MSRTKEDIAEDLRAALPYIMKAVEDAKSEYAKVELAIVGTNPDEGRVLVRFDPEILVDVGTLVDWDGEVVSDEEHAAAKLVDAMARGKVPLG